MEMNEQNQQNRQEGWGEEMEFFIFLLEHYASCKNLSTGQVMQLWDEHHLVDEIYEGYWLYHMEALENAFADIDCLLETGKHLPI